MPMTDGTDPSLRYASGLALSPDGKELAAVHDGRIVVWNVRTGKVGRVVGATDVARPLLRWNPARGQLLTAAADSRLLLRDPSRDAVLAQLVGHATQPDGSGVVDAIFTPDGAGVVSVGADRTVRRWDARRASEVAQTSLADGLVPRRLALSPSGEEVVVVRASGRALLLDAESLRSTGELNPVETTVASPRDVVFGPDGTFLAAMSPTGIWMGRINDAELRQIVALPRPDSVHAVFSRDGVLYTSSGRGGIRAWRPATGRMLRTFEDPPGA